ncbi:unnamed protein product, partial [marine sediment metagenome]
MTERKSRFSKELELIKRFPKTSQCAFYLGVSLAMAQKGDMELARLYLEAQRDLVKEITKEFD